MSIKTGTTTQTTSIEKLQTGIAVASKVLMIGGLVGGAVASLLMPLLVQRYFSTHDLHWVWIAIDEGGQNSLSLAVWAAAVAVGAMGMIALPLIFSIGVTWTIFGKTRIDVRNGDWFVRYSDYLLYCGGAAIFFTLVYLAVHHDFPDSWSFQFFLAWCAGVAIIDGLRKNKAGLLSAREVYKPRYIQLPDNSKEVVREVSTKSSAFFYISIRIMSALGLSLPFIGLVSYVVAVSPAASSVSQWVLVAIMFFSLALLYSLANLRGALAAAFIVLVLSFVVMWTLPAGAFSAGVMRFGGLGNYLAKLECISEKCTKSREALGDIVFVAWSFRGEYAVTKPGHCSQGVLLSRGDAKLHKLIQSEAEEASRSLPKESRCK